MLLNFAKFDALDRIGLEHLVDQVLQVFRDPRWHEVMSFFYLVEQNVKLVIVEGK
jgi:hypothetical protein